MRTAVYPGTFDPLTNGHVDIVRRALTAFDRVVVALGINSRKTALFSADERQAMIEETFATEPRVSVDTFQGLQVDYLKSIGAVAVIRGLRAVSDFEFEFQMANMNRKLYPEAETFFLMTGQDNFYLSSSLIKEVALLGGCVEGLVPPAVAHRLARKFGG
ncbi:MAG: pantetheine-phosphate adenylyltransferase [Deltaproteobacteria bacterium]|nr:pantetheine-phosphate adenylyltransferase [Deltaproteobacteria bacterium]